MQLDPATRRAIEKTRAEVGASEAGLRSLCFPSQLLREHHQERGGGTLRDVGKPGTWLEYADHDWETARTMRAASRPPYLTENS